MWDIILFYKVVTATATKIILIFQLLWAKIRTLEMLDETHFLFQRVLHTGKRYVFLLVGMVRDILKGIRQRSNSGEVTFIIK